MAEYTVTWKAEARGMCSVEADSEEEAMQKITDGEGDDSMEIHNVNELSDFEVVEAEWAQG